MSVDVSSAVWNHAPREVAGGLKLVLLVIADHASDDGGDAWPSVETMANKCCLDRRTVQRHLRKLETMGLIEREGRGGGLSARNDKRPTSYRVCLERLQAAARPREAPSNGAAPMPPRDPNGAAPVSQRGGTAVLDGAAPMPPEPSLNRPEPPSRAPAREGAPAVGGDPGGPGWGGMDDPKIDQVLDALGAQLPHGTPPVEGDGRYRDLRRAITIMVGHGWTAHELASECADAPRTLRHPAAWLLARLREVYHQQSPRAAQAVRAAATTAALDAHEAIERTPRPPDLDLPAFLVGVTGPGRPDDPDRSREGG